MIQLTNRNGLPHPGHVFYEISILVGWTLRHDSVAIVQLFSFVPSLHDETFLTPQKEIETYFYNMQLINYMTVLVIIVLETPTEHVGCFTLL